MVSDLSRAFTYRQLIWHLAKNEIFASVHLTFLGPLWLIVQPLLWMLTIVLLVQPFVANPSFHYPLYVAIGIVLYSGIQTFLSAGAQTFVRDKTRILNVALPLSVFALKNPARVAIELAITSAIVIGTMVLYPPKLGPVMLLAIPGMALYFVFGFGCTLALGVLAARITDIIYLTNALMRVMLFMTPVFWLPEQTSGARHWFALYNPLHHLLAIVRDPLMGVMPQPLNYAVAASFAFAALVSGLLLFARFRGRIAVWI